MNFALAGTGHSFKGAMAYYLTDKRQEGQSQHPNTAERVDWTETRNLMTDGPHTATRIMIATAEQADELKKAAGVKNTGRKATGGPVFSFSLAWHPSEAGQIDRAEMVKAADHAIKTLGLDHLQAVIIAHRDTAHPHVHVVVNRVDPNTGKTQPIRKPDVLALDKWADSYERERGKIVSPNRAKKYDEIEKKKQRHPDPAKRKQYIQDRDAARKQEAAQPVSKDKTPAAMLKELGDAQKARHRQEWAKLAAEQKARRTAVYEAAAARIKQATAVAKEEARPEWSFFFRHQRDERRRFEERERTLAGIVRNCIAAAKLQERHGEPSARGFLTTAFQYLASRDRRQADFTARQEAARLDLAAAMKIRTDERIAQIRQQRTQALKAGADQYGKDRAALIEKQDAERAKVREAWRQLNLQRGRKPEPQQQREKPTMRDFDRARLPDANRPKIEPTKQQHLATPMPAPAPAGLPQPPARTPQDVPKIDPIAEWLKSTAGRDAMTKHQPAPPARQQFGKTSEPKPEPQRPTPAATQHQPAPAARQQFGRTAETKPEPQQQAPAAAKPQSRADYWNDRAKEKAPDRAERDRGRDRDLDFDRER